MVILSLYRVAVFFMLTFYCSAIVLAQVPLQNPPGDVAKSVEISDSDKTSNDIEDEKLDENENDLVHFGDLIDVDILGSTEYDWRGEITPEGFLDGIEFTKEEIFGRCQTVNQIASDIEKSYSSFLNNPKVVVTILDRTNRQVTTLYGAVKLPQRFKIKRKVFLNELIVLAGGFTEKASGEIQILRPSDASCAAKIKIKNDLANNNNRNDENIIKVSRGTGSKFINIKISDLLNGKIEANPQILYGDIVTVLTSEPIYIIGGVVNPSKISIREKMTLTRAIASAGGLTKRANPENITIFRREEGKTKVIKINLNDINQGNFDDFDLKAYDIIDIPENGRDQKKYPPILRFDSLDVNKNSNLPLRTID